MSRPCVCFVHSWSVGNFSSPPSTLLDLGATRPTLVSGTSSGRVTQTTSSAKHGRPRNVRRLPNQGAGRAQAEALSSAAPEKARTWRACVRVASRLLAWSVRSQYFLRGVTSPGEQGRCSQCSEASIRSSEELDRSHLHPQPSARGATPGLELGMGLWDGAVW